MATSGALSCARSSRGTLLRPLKFSLTTGPQRVRAATPAQRVWVRHHRPMFLRGIVSGIHETGLCTLQRAGRFRESADASPRWKAQPKKGRKDGDRHGQTVSYNLKTPRRAGTPTALKPNAACVAVARTRSGVMSPASPAMTRRYTRGCRRTCASQFGSAKRRANSPSITRFSSRSAETENDAVSYIIDFMWLPGPDSNQRPSG
jgi:hypothetical protein